MSGRSNHQITQVSVTIIRAKFSNQCISSKRFHFSEKPKEQDLLVIPLKNSQKTSAALASLRNLQSTLNGEADASIEVDNKNDTTTQSPINGSAATLEERVVNELLAEARNDGVDNEENATTLTLPMKKDEPTLDGAKESSIDDYESIPIAQFGMAMLRGMGLKDEEIRAKNAKEPELRPRGMGLGADKLAKPKKLLVAPAANEVLEIRKNACVRILAGKYKDLYGQVNYGIPFIRLVYK